ncbi:SCO family protein [Salinimonas marina]|uniref:SCO family protein n=1 Tax=Salinimonas marina TaxID=2785918 RepID=A0A7S9DX73_9ALTE|nr:SCO family protein [Salinimonas marina]QPG05608.1 SCO family protein [Salinimonas marina]
MKQNTIIGLVLVIAFVAGIWAAITIAPPEHAISAPEPEHFQAYPATRSLPDFSLTRANGETLNAQSLQNQWTLVFLGYTYCPDICPATMAGFNRIYSQLQAIESEYPIRVLFVSVDPGRDTPARLASYKSYFNEDFIAATGDHGQVFPLVRSFGLVYALSESTEQGDYLVDHSASVVLVSPKAQVVGRFKPDSTVGQLSVVKPEHIVTDMPVIIANYP